MDSPESEIQSPVSPKEEKGEWKKDQWSHIIISRKCKTATGVCVWGGGRLGEASWAVYLHANVRAQHHTGRSDRAGGSGSGLLSQTSVTVSRPLGTRPQRRSSTNTAQLTLFLQAQGADSEQPCFLTLSPWKTNREQTKAKAQGPPHPLLPFSVYCQWSSHMNKWIK